MSETNEPKKVNRSTGFYESKGMSRYMLIITKPHKDKLDALTVKYDITQAGLIEVLLDTFNENSKEVIEAIHNRAKVSRVGRPVKNPTKTSVTKMLKDMTPEQLKAAQELIFNLTAKK